MLPGRSKTSVEGVIEKYNIPYDYIISNNGAVIYNKNMEKIYDKSISSNVSTKILDYLETKENIEVFLYDDDDKIKYHNQELLKIRIRTPYYELGQIIEDEVNSIFKNDVIAHSAFPGMYYDNQDFVIIDIVSKDAGKEKAIKKLLEILNIEKEQVVTVGDGRNDIKMIKEYNGYSMETAEEEAKKSASKIFESIAELLMYLENN